MYEKSSSGARVRVECCKRKGGGTYISNFGELGPELPEAAGMASAPEAAIFKNCLL